MYDTSATGYNQRNDVSHVDFFQRNYELRIKEILLHFQLLPSHFSSFFYLSPPTFRFCFLRQTCKFIQK